MWDWELLKNGSKHHHYHIYEQYRHEDFQYTHAVSYGTERDEYGLHNHGMYELVYCLGGNVAYLAEGLRYELEPGSLLIISPTTLHRLFICSDQPYERYILYVNYLDKRSPFASLITQCQQPMGDARIGSAYYSPQDVSSLRSAFERVSAACSAENESLRSLTPSFVQALLAELLMTVHTKVPRQYSTGTCKPVDSLMQYINQNYTRDISLQSIADHFFLSKDYCNRLFKKNTGMSIMQYVISNRVFLAKQLLTDGVAAAEAAKRTGFSDYSTFYRSYRKITGRSPSDDYGIAEEVADTPEALRME